MFINAIKIKTNDLKTLAYKFGPSTGKHRNIVVLSAKADELDIYKKAVTYALTGINSHSNQILEVNISVSDDNGDQWIVTRSADISRFFRNRKEVLKDAEPSFVKALLDLPTEHIITDTERQQVLRLVHADFRKQHLLGSLESLREKTKVNLFEAQLAKLMEASKNTVQDILGLELDLVQLETVYNSCFPYLWQWMSLSDHLNTLAPSIHEEAFAQNHQIRELEAQLELIASLEQVSSFVRDPANSPIGHKEQLAALTAQIEAIQQSLPAQASISNTSPELWQSALNIICKYYAFGKLEQAFQKVRVRIDHTYKPLTKDYLESIYTFLDNDKHILAELEQALSLLAQHFTSAQDKLQAQNNKSLLGRFEKLLSKQVDSSAEDVNIRRKNLDKSRQLVDEILAKIGEMHSNVGLSSQSMDQSYGDIQDKYEYLIKEFGKYKSAWLKISKKIGLDPATSIADFLSIMKKVHRLSELQTQKNLYQNKITEYKTTLKKIVAILEKWYALIGSHKPQELNQASVILRETKGILSYQKPKLEKLNRTLKDRAISVGISDFKASFSKETELLRKKWEQPLIAMGIESKRIKRDQWHQLHCELSKIFSLSTLTEKSEAPMVRPLSEWMKELASETPLTIIDIAYRPLTQKEQDLILASVAHASPHGHALILVHDEVLAESLASAGLGVGMKVEASQKPSSAPNIQTEIKAKSEPLMSDKAKAAIDILRAKGI